MVDLRMARREHRRITAAAVREWYDYAYSNHLNELMMYGSWEEYVYVLHGYQDQWDEYHRLYPENYYINFGGIR